MSIHRYAARVDANQTQIVSALRAAGALVWHIKLPMDLLVGDRESGRIMLMDCKMPKTGSKTALQARFEREWAGLPISFVDGPEAALRHFRLLGAKSLGHLSGKQE